MGANPSDCGCKSLVSEGGISGSNSTVEINAAHVGPTTGAEFNTVRAGLVPVACWRVEDIRFEFDSSFVNPGIEVELEHLMQLVKDHPPSSMSNGKPGCPLSVFGHADPIGNDDYNKQLSGRRATAIYALLTRDTTLWEKLFSQPFGNDKWGRKSLETMLDTVSPPPEGKSNQEQAIQHEHNAGKRKELYGKYMDKLCSPELKLKKKDFLGHGDDAGGKGDFQGCSEFNPVLIFSQEEQTKFDQDKDNTERNAANAPNRRVMVLIFRKGSRVDPSQWPCPRASEGVVSCKKRFFSDGEKRRSAQLPDKPRKFEETKDTFACRFYNRLTNNSPCEHLISGDRWIIRVDKKQGLKPEDTVTLESKAVFYRSKISVRNAVDIGEFLDFLFVPGPESDYTVSLTVGGTSYFAWIDLHLPGDGQGINPSKFDYGSTQDHPNPYAVSSGHDPNNSTITFDLC